MAESPRRDGVFEGVALASAAVPVIYTLVRALESALAPEIAPAAVVWSERSAMIDRLTVMAFAVAMLSTGCVGWARTRNLGRVIRGVSVLGSLAVGASIVWFVRASST